MLLTNALIALFANAIASNATSSRLVFSMARDGQLPSILGRVSERKVPRNSMIFIAALSSASASWEWSKPACSTTLVTFGALTAYVLLNVAVINYFGPQAEEPPVPPALASPAIGLAILLLRCVNANPHAQDLGRLRGLRSERAVKASGRSMEQATLTRPDSPTQDRILTASEQEQSLQ